VIDISGLRNLCGFPEPELFSEQYRQWVQDAISDGKNQRESCWTESIAVGGIGFIEETKATLGIKGSSRWNTESIINHGYGPPENRAGQPLIM